MREKGKKIQIPKSVPILGPICSQDDSRWSDKKSDRSVPVVGETTSEFDFG